MADYDELNYIQGAYFAAGLGSPDKYPDKPLLRKEKTESNEGLTNEQLALMLGVNHGSKE